MSKLSQTQFKPNANAAYHVPRVIYTVVAFLLLILLQFDGQDSIESYFSELTESENHIDHISKSTSSSRKFVEKQPKIETIVNGSSDCPQEDCETLSDIPDSTAVKVKIIPTTLSINPTHISTTTLPPKTIKINTQKTHSTKKNHDFSESLRSNTCKNLLAKGHWEDLEYWGWETETTFTTKDEKGKLVRKTITTDDVKHPHYPWHRWDVNKNTTNPYNIRETFLQGYSGRWVPEEDCELHLYSINKQESVRCLENSGDLHFLGDSRGRQLAKLFMGAGYGHGHIKFHDSRSFDPRNESRFGMNLWSGTDNVINDVLNTPASRAVSLITFSDHLLHPIMYWAHKTHSIEGELEKIKKEEGNEKLTENQARAKAYAKINHVDEIDENWVHVMNNVVLTKNDSLFAKEVTADILEKFHIKRLVNLLELRPELQIVFTASAMPLRASLGGMREHMERYVDGYNYYVKKIVDDQNHPRMMFMSVVHKLGLTDDGHCLLADGTHFDYPNDATKYGARLDATKYYLNILMNLLCPPSVQISRTQNFCC